MNLDDLVRVIVRYELMLGASQQQVLNQQETIADLTTQRDRLQEALDALANRDAAD